MVEASQVDWACHANDPAQLLSDLLAYDKAVETALSFAEKDGNTLVLAVSDHNTGGFSIGNYATDMSYSQTREEAFLDPFRKMRVSAPVLWKMTGKNLSAESVVKAVKTGWGMDIETADAEHILAATKKYLSIKTPFYAFGEILCPKYTMVGWCTHGHSGGDVPLHAYGPGKPMGRLDGPEIGQTIAGALGIDLQELTQRLYADAFNALAGAKVVVDDADSQNPVIRVTRQGKTFFLPVNKNALKEKNTVHPLEACSIYIRETGKAYIPRQAASIIMLQDIPE
jgi:alkaline phosphatase